MARFTRAEIEARLVEVRDALSKARKAQVVAAGANMSLSRGNLKNLLDEEQMLLAELDKLDAQASGGTWNKGRFVRPL